MQYPRENLDTYLKRFHEKALDCCNPVAKDVLVDVCLNGLVEDYRYTWRIWLSLLSPG